MKPFVRKLYVRARKAVSLDTRALSLFRIGIALLLLTDLAIRAGDLEVFYSDAGVLPREMVRNVAWNPVYAPFYMLSGSVVYSACLFCLAALFALLLLIGWRTRLFTVLSWAMLIALHNRNPFILQGGDELLRNALFWAMFLPLGQHYSIDARSGRGTGMRKQFRGMAAAGYALLIFSVYFFSALQKNSAEWQTEGSALYYALSMDQVLLPAGKLIYHYPLLLKTLTHLTYAIELGAGFLLLWPGRKQRARMTGIVLLAGLHAGIGLTLYVGLFFLIGLVTLLPLLPAPVMDRFDRLLRRRAKPVRIHPPRKPAAWTSRALTGFLLLVLVYCFCWNFSNTHLLPYKFSQPARYPAALLRIDQNWGMFAPKVFKDDGWYILEGELNGGTLIDLNRGGQPVRYEKPASIVALFPNDRWRKYSENLLFTFNEYLRPSYCNYVLRNWNAAHPGRAVKLLRVVYMKEISLPGYRVSPVERCVLSECRK